MCPVTVRIGSAPSTASGTPSTRKADPARGRSTALVRNDVAGVLTGDPRADRVVAVVHVHATRAGVDPRRPDRRGRRPLRIWVLVGLDAGLHVHVVRGVLPVGVGAAGVRSAVVVRVTRRLTIGTTAVAVGRLLGARRRVVVEHVAVRRGTGALVVGGTACVIGAAALVHGRPLGGRSEADAVGAGAEGEVDQTLGVRCRGRVTGILRRDAENDGATVGGAVDGTSSVVVAAEAVVLAVVQTVVGPEVQQEAVRGDLIQRGLRPGVGRDAVGPDGLVGVAV